MNRKSSIFYGVASLIGYWGSAFFVTHNAITEFVPNVVISLTMATIVTTVHYFITNRNEHSIKIMPKGE